MARIIYADSFSTEQTLFSSIYANHILLGGKSPLILFCKQQKLDMDKLFAAIKPAADQDKTRILQKSASESNTEKRNNNMARPWENLQSEVQFLKGHFQGSERELGLWGITVDGKNKIVYPPTFLDRAQLIETFLGVHASYPAGESPLQVFLDINPEIVVADDLSAVGDAKKNDADRIVTDNASQQATQQRDKIWDPVVKAIHLIGDFLMALYKGASKEMLNWGFVVVEDAAGPTEQVTTVNPTTNKVISGIVIPSTAINIGTVTLTITKGKGKNLETLILEAGEKMGMNKGFSRVTVSNNSTLEIGKIKVLVSK